MTLVRLSALLVVLAPFAGAAGAAGAPRAAPAPPVTEAREPSAARRPPPREEPALHSHGNPTGEEQELLELMNRARADPKAEAGRVFRDYGDPLVTAPVNHFLLTRPGIEWTRTENRRAFASYPPRPPLAFDARLLAAARGHSRRMSEAEEQSHQLPGEPVVAARITASGYPWVRLTESVFAHGDSILHAHAAFAIDYGQDLQLESGDPYQPRGRGLLGHRLALMEFDGRAPSVHVGVGIVKPEPEGSRVGPLVVTIDFAVPDDDVRYVTGVCYEDRDGDGFYDRGEGLAGLRVECPEAGTLTFTSASGGYALPVPAGHGTVTVVATGETGGESELIGRAERTVTLAGSNVKLDFTPATDSDPPDFVRAWSAGPLALSDGGITDSALGAVAADPERATLSDLEVDVTLDHDDASELRLVLESPVGTQVVLADRGLGVRDLAGTFGGSLVPEEPLTAFLGEPFEGTWTLRVHDSGGRASGTLSSWALRLRPEWQRDLHSEASSLRLQRLSARGGGGAGGGRLTIAGTLDAPDAHRAADDRLLLRLRRADGPGGELLRLDATALAAAGAGTAGVRVGIGGTSRATFRADLHGLDLPPLPREVIVEVAAAGTLASQTVALDGGRFDARTARPVSPVFAVHSIVSRPAGSGRSTIVRGRFLDPSIDRRGVLEVGVGTGRAGLSPGAFRRRGRRSSVRTSAALRSLVWDARTGAFSFRLVEDHEAATEGVSRVFLRIGGGYGDAEVSPRVAGKSVSY